MKIFDMMFLVEQTFRFCLFLVVAGSDVFFQDFTLVDFRPESKLFYGPKRRNVI